MTEHRWPRDRRESPFRARAAWCVGRVVVVLCLAVLVGCGGDGSEAERGVTVSEVVEDAERFAGKEVTVTGRIDVVTQGALTLGDQALLVYAVDRAQRSLEGSGFGHNEEVHITGTVGVMDYQALLKRLPSASQLPPRFRDFERQPVLLASRIVPYSF